ncbi:MAG: NAD+ synthase [Candidatus Bathyarchaeia archaeon]
MQHEINVSKVDPEKTMDEITSFIRGVVGSSGASGVVLGLSGGIDSSLVAALCTRAIGSDRVLGIIMPTSFTPNEDIEDAAELAKTLGIKYIIVNIDGIVDSFIRSLNVDPNDSRVRMPLANLRARVRMAILYFYANLYNLLVAGTSDKSEYLIGYFTKYGDGAADFFPIRHLYKTQVRELAAYLGLPERIVRKPSSPQLYPGHKISDELPVDYPIIDKILIGLLERNLTCLEVSRILGIPKETAENILLRHKRSAHKRLNPKVIEEDKSKF